MPQQLWNGLVSGSLYALIALGYTLLFGVIKVVFFAQGELSMVSAFAVLAVLALWPATNGPAGLPVLAIAAAAGIVVAVTAGLLAERVAMRPLREAPRVQALISSLGVSIVLQNAVMLVAGPQPRRFQLGEPAGGWHLGSVRVAAVDVWLLLVLAVAATGLHLFLHRHPSGLALRAVAQNPIGARLMAVEIDKTIATAFLISSTIAGVAGVLMGAYFGAARFSMGFVPGIKGFTVAILGGAGSTKGAVAGGIALGMAEALFAGFVSSDYRDFMVFSVLVVILATRPTGLFGESVSDPAV